MQGCRHRRCPQGASLPCSCLEDSFAAGSCGARFVPARVPVPSAVRAARAGPGGDRAVSLHVTYSRATTAPTLPQPPSLPRSQSRRWFPVQQHWAEPGWACAKVPGWGCSRGSRGGGLGGDPTAPGSAPGLLPPLPSPPAPPLSGLRTAGFAPPFSRAPPVPLLPAAGTPDPARLLAPLVHVASAGRARAA